jgi:prophage regulatory protein
MNKATSSTRYLEIVLALPLANRLVNAKEIAIRTGKSIPWIYHEEKAGRFPKRIRIGIRGVAWEGADVQHWIDSRIASS